MLRTFPRIIQSPKSHNFVGIATISLDIQSPRISTNLNAPEALFRETVGSNQARCSHPPPVSQRRGAREARALVGYETSPRAPTHWGHVSSSDWSQNLTPRRIWCYALSKNQRSSCNVAVASPFILTVRSLGW